MPEAAESSQFSIPEGSELQALLQRCPDIELMRFRDEELLVRGGDESLDIFLVVRGSCLVENTGPIENTPAERKPGTELAVVEATPEAPVFVGEMAYLGDGRRSASVRSVMASWVLRLKPEHLDFILGGGPPGFPQLTRVLCRQFARRLAETNVQLRHFQTRHAMNTALRFLSPGEVLFQAGDAVGALFQLITGRLSCETAAETEIIAPKAGNPVLINARAYFARQPQECTVRAETGCTLIEVSGESILAAIRNHPEEVLALLAPPRA